MTLRYAPICYGGEIMFSRAARVVSSTLTVVAALAITAPAHAAYTFELTVTGPSAFTGSGSIDFDTLSGNSAADLSAFDFHVSAGFGSPQDYDLGDIASISWTIDGAFNLTSVLLESVLIPFGSDQSGLLLAIGQSAPTDPCGFTWGSNQSATCIRLQSGGGAGNSGALTAELQPVPEPSSYALVLGGLGLLGWVARRRAS
jgi:hypothetical protein